MNAQGNNHVDSEILNAEFNFDTTKPYQFSQHLEGLLGTQKTEGTKPLTRYAMKGANVPVKQFESMAEREETKATRRLKKIEKPAEN